MNEVKFMYNGIKINGKLIKGHWSKGNYTNGALYCFYADSYFSKELREVFSVKNESDIMIDYFETDKIYFFAGDKYLKEVENSFKQQEIKNLKSKIKRLEKEKTKRPLYFEDYLKKEYEECKRKLEVA